MLPPIDFPVGTKIIVADKLETVVDKVEWVDTFEEYFSYFKDEEGKTWTATFLEIKKSEKNEPTSFNIVYGFPCKKRTVIKSRTNITRLIRFSQWCI